MTAPDPLVLICGLDHANVTEEEAVFKAAGLRWATAVARTEDDFLQRCGEAAGLLIQYGEVTRRVVEGLPRLRLLVRCRTGGEHPQVAIDLHRIGIDHDAAELPGEPDAQGGLA